MESDHKKRRTAKHVCKLPKEDIILDLIPGNDFKSKLKRIYHKTLMINSCDPRTRIHCESLHSIRMQQIEHVTKYPFFIHPISIFRTIWDVLMVITDLIMLTYIPSNRMFCHYPVDHIRVECSNLLWLLLCILCVMDIGFNFITVYYPENRKFIHNYLKIAWNYLEDGRVIFDFLSLIPFFWSVRVEPGGNVHFNVLYTIFTFCRLSHLIMQLGKLLQFFRLRLVIIKLFKLFIFTIFPLHYLTCLVVMDAIYRIEFDDAGLPTRKQWLTRLGLWNSSNAYIYIMALYKSCCLVSGSDEYGITSSSSNIHRTRHLLKLMFWLISRVIFALVIWYLNSIIVALLQHKANYTKLQVRVRRFSKSRSLSKKLTRKMLTYYKFLYARVIFKEKEIFSSISTKMKQDIIITTRMNYLLNINFFKLIPKNLLKAFCFFFQENIHLTGDVINSGKKTGQLMIMISGTAACYTSTGVEFLHLVDGDFCSELEFIPNYNVFSTIVALEPCKVYCLDLQDFYRTLSAVSQYSDLMNRLQLHIENYVEFYKKLETHIIQLFQEVQITKNMHLPRNINSD